MHIVLINAHYSKYKIMKKYVSLFSKTLKYAPLLTQIATQNTSILDYICIFAHK